MTKKTITITYHGHSWPIFNAWHFFMQLLKATIYIQQKYQMFFPMPRSLFSVGSSSLMCYISFNMYHIVSGVLNWTCPGWLDFFFSVSVRFPEVGLARDIIHFSLGCSIPDIGIITPNIPNSSILDGDVPWSTIGCYWGIPIFGNPQNSRTSDLLPRFNKGLPRASGRRCPENVTPKHSPLIPRELGRLGPPRRALESQGRLGWRANHPLEVERWGLSHHLRIQGRLSHVFKEWICIYHMYRYYIWLVVLTILKNMKVNEKDYPIYYGQ